MKGKKGQILEQIGGLAVGVVALAILLVVAFMIMNEGKDQALSLETATSISNETIVPTNQVDYVLFTGKCVDGTLGGCVVRNESETIPASNYTCANQSIKFDEFGEREFGFTGFSLNVSYSCKVGDEAYNSTEELQNATDDIPTWVPIIIITFIGVILLGLVALIRRSQ